MDRREFLAAGVLSSLSTAVHGASATAEAGAAGPRARFAGLDSRTYLNAAGMMPLGSFAAAGLERYIDFQRLGPGDGRRAYVGEAHSGARERFAELIGARPDEIALVPCTKAGEEIVLDGLDPMRHGRNIVTNDMHFSGSLHNLVGLRRAGADVRIIRSRDWDITLEEMTDAIDDDTALVCVTLLSNVTGRIEAVRELADAAHQRGALIYVDIIQAAGIVPIDVAALGIDFAAANGYKWLYGTYGAGFLYVRHDLQGTALPDRLFPGHLRFNYAPWTDSPKPGAEDFDYRPNDDGRRYEPGHVNYMGYCAVYEGLGFLGRVGIDKALSHSVALNRSLAGRIDQGRFRCLTPDIDRSPILTLHMSDTERLKRHLEEAGVVASVGGNYLRISPALFSTESDIQALADVLEKL